MFLTADLERPGQTMRGTRDRGPWIASGVDPRAILEAAVCSHGRVNAEERRFRLDRRLSLARRAPRRQMRRRDHQKQRLAYVVHATCRQKRLIMR